MPGSIKTAYSMTKRGKTLGKERTMDKGIVALAAMGLIVGTCLVGCEKTSKEKVENAKENVESAQQELKDARAGYLAEWEIFKTESAQKIEANERSIAVFKEKIKEGGSTVNRKFAKEVSDLEQMNRDLKKKLEEYDGGQSQWLEFKADFKGDLDQIGKKIEGLFRDNQK
jgi:mannitol-specific phosphotransferase system IIBC component